MKHYQFEIRQGFTGYLLFTSWVRGFFDIMLIHSSFPIYKLEDNVFQAFKPTFSYIDNNTHTNQGKTQLTNEE